MLRRGLLTALSFAALVAGPALLLSARAGAEVTGPCTATMNGVDVNTIDTPDTALEVPYDGTITIEVQSSGEITGHVVKLEPIGGVAFTADEGADDGNGWSGTVEVADYATYGVGIYKVTGEATGPGACSGAAYVKVTGKSPLTTAAGAVGAALTVVGAAGVGVGALRLQRQRAYHDPAWDDPNDPDFGWEEPPEEDPEERSARPGCFGAAVLMLGWTLAYMVSGMGTPGASAVPPVRFRPRVSVGMSLWSVAFGLGTVILAQQFAVLYPTVLLTIAWLVVCVLLGGLLVPSLISLAAARSANATRAARATRAANAARAAGAAPSNVGTVDLPAPPAAVASAWAPTHRVPVDGLDAWPAPDPASAQPVRLDPGLDLRVVQTSGDWAQVTASNGWTGWVDGRRLGALG